MKGCWSWVILFGILVGCSDSTENIPPEEDTFISTEDVAPISGPGSEEDPCTLPILVGPCEAAMPRFGYSPDLNECLEFTYGGCDGNSNRFSTVEECEALCVTPPEEDIAQEDGLQDILEDAEDGDSTSTDAILDGEKADDTEVEDSTEPDSDESPEADVEQDGESDEEEPADEDGEQEEPETGAEP